MGNTYLRIPALWEQGARRANGQNVLSALNSSATRTGVVQEGPFQNRLALERRRAERSRNPFVLMLLDASQSSDTDPADLLISRVTPVLLRSTRETDLVGWYKNGVILGILFTEVTLEGTTPITEVLHTKVLSALHSGLSRKVISKLAVTVHLFPENRDRGGAEPVGDIKLYPDVYRDGSRKRLPVIANRMIDIIGSAVWLIFFSPLLAAIALAIKLTSKGPVIFRQERVGQFGARFKCLKFRTMYQNNDSRIHQEYIQRFIPGQSGSDNTEPGKPAVYRITNDPRA